ncbi:MAG: TPM domain-containing protein [Candidatus Woesearchaeota archaeon]
MSRQTGMWSMERLGKMILALAGLAIIIFLLNTLFSILGQETGPQACRSSVMGRMNIKDNLPGYADDTVARKIPLACETEEVTIPQELTKRMDDNDVRLQTMEEMADLAATCWWMFGNGEYNDVFANKWAPENLCHACYIVKVKDVEALDEPITTEEFKNYLDTHNYAPGLLRAGGASNADNRFYEFEPQTLAESSRESRRMNPQRLLNSKRRLERHVADFTGLFSEDQRALNTLRTQLETIDTAHGIAPAFILIPSLPADVWDEEQPVARNILNEWSVGSETLDNGYVFLFSFNDGKLQYANDVGSSAVLPPYVVEALLEEHFKPDAASGEPREALLNFAEELEKTLDNSEEDSEELMQFQRTYTAYITGGRTGSTLIEGVLTSDDIRPKGSITFTGEDEDPFLIRGGGSHIITFTSPEWYNTHFKREHHLNAPSIGFAYTEDFMNNAPCNLHED